MKALGKNVVREKHRLFEEQKKAELEAKLAAMTPEERAEWDRKHEEDLKRGREALRNFAMMSSMFRGEYSK
jgi:hypothetical protein